MCRWFAYSGPPLPLASLLTRPDHSLIDQSLRARENVVTTNGDGFGVGWYGLGPTPGVFRDTHPAWNNTNLRSLTDHIVSPLFLAHVRAATGTPVLASGPGTVVLASDLYYSGNTVIVDHGGGLFTLYAHLSRLGVDEGQQVAAGDRVGLSGATGRVTGPHLHWGAKIGDLPFDPRALLDGSLFGD